MLPGNVPVVIENKPIIVTQIGADSADGSGTLTIPITKKAGAWLLVICSAFSDGTLNTPELDGTPLTVFQNSGYTNGNDLRFYGIKMTTSGAGNVTLAYGDSTNMRVLQLENLKTGYLGAGNTLHTTSNPSSLAITAQPERSVVIGAGTTRASATITPADVTLTQMEVAGSYQPACIINGENTPATLSVSAGNRVVGWVAMG